LEKGEIDLGPEGVDSEDSPMAWGRLLAFGIPACAIAGPNFLVQSYFLNFSTDVLLIAPAPVLVVDARGCSPLPLWFRRS
jgi:hypothetical protein